VNLLAISMDGVAVGAFAFSAALVGAAVRAGVEDPAARATVVLAPRVGTRSASRERDLFGAIGRIAPGRRLQRWLARKPDVIRRVELAGAARSPQDLSGRMVAGAAWGVFLLVGAAAIAPPLFVLAPIGALVGGRCPIIRLSRAAKRRQARIDAQVPELVELLVAGTEAGLPPATAFSRAAELVPGPLGDEVRTAAAQTDLGLPWRSALEALVRRTDAPALGSMARAHQGPSTGRLGPRLPSNHRRGTAQRSPRARRRISASGAGQDAVSPGLPHPPRVPPPHGWTGSAVDRPIAALTGQTEHGRR
jgi:Flp pilus assembly protein TadB